MTNPVFLLDGLLPALQRASKMAGRSGALPETTKLLVHTRVSQISRSSLVLLADQDPADWDAAQIADGRAELDRAIALGGRGAYVLQAAIAALHADTPRDWTEIAALYAELHRVTGSPVVALSHAAAVGEAVGPEAGLAAVDDLSGRLDSYLYFHAARADLLRRTGRDAEAAAAYRRALTLVGSDSERRFLARRLAALI